MESTFLAYTGPYRDGVAGGYPLGNGYRVYLPWLMRFAAPDSWSPFGQGGFNPYAYCVGNPINRSDPSGHVSDVEELSAAARAVADAVERQEASSLAGRDARSAESSKPAKSMKELNEDFGQAFSAAEKTWRVSKRFGMYDAMIRSYGNNSDIPAYERANLYWNAAADAIEIAEDWVNTGRTLTINRPSLMNALKYTDTAIGYMSNAKALYVDPGYIEDAGRLLGEYRQAREKVLSRFTAAVPDYQAGGAPEGVSSRDNRVLFVWGDSGGREIVVPAPDAPPPLRRMSYRRGSLDWDM